MRPPATRPAVDVGNVMPEFHVGNFMSAMSRRRSHVSEVMSAKSVAPWSMAAEKR
jgi:hypothetical protein